MLSISCSPVIFPALSTNQKKKKEEKKPCAFSRLVLSKHDPKRLYYNWREKRGQSSKTIKYNISGARPEVFIGLFYILLLLLLNIREGSKIALVFSLLDQLTKSAAVTAVKPPKQTPLSQRKKITNNTILFLWLSLGF